MATASSRSTASIVVWGFIAGALSVLIFHQLTILVLNGFNFAGVWRMNPRIPPFGVPLLLNAMFWGGVWGVLFAAITPRLPRGFGYLICGFLFGAIVLVLSGWYLVPFIKSLFGVGNLRYGPNPIGWWRSPVIHGMWGLGTAILLSVMPRK